MAQGVNSLSPGKFEWNFRYVIFKQILLIDGSGISCEIALILNAKGLHWWSVNIGSGNGLVLSGNKPLPGPVLTQDLCRHMASLGHNELNSLFVENKDPLIPYSQYHRCWWPGIPGTQAISSYDIDLVLFEYASVRSRRFNMLVNALALSVARSSDIYSIFLKNNPAHQG